MRNIQALTLRVGLECLVNYSNSKFIMRLFVFVCFYICVYSSLHFILFCLFVFVFFQKFCLRIQWYFERLTLIFLHLTVTCLYSPFTFQHLYLSASSLFLCILSKFLTLNFNRCPIIQSCRLRLRSERQIEYAELAIFGSTKFFNWC